MGLYWVCREFLYEGGIVITAINTAGEREEDDKGEKLFANPIEIKCWVEWAEIVSYDTVQSIAIRMREIRDIKDTRDISMSEAIEVWAQDMIDK